MGFLSHCVVNTFYIAYACLPSMDDASSLQIFCGSLDISFCILLQVNVHKGFWSPLVLALESPARTGIK